MSTYDERKVAYEQLRQLPIQLLDSLSSEASISLSKNLISKFVRFNVTWIRNNRDEVLDYVKLRLLRTGTLPVVKVIRLMKALRRIKEFDLCHKLAVETCACYPLPFHTLLVNYVQASGFIEAIEGDDSAFPVNKQHSLKVWLEMTLKNPDSKTVTLIAKRHPEVGLLILKQFVSRETSQDISNNFPVSVDIINALIVALVKDNNKSRVLAVWNEVKNLVEKEPKYMKSIWFDAFYDLIPAEVFSWTKTQPHITYYAKEQKKGKRYARYHRFYYHWHQNKNHVEGIPENVSLSTRGFKKLSKAQIKTAVQSNLSLQRRFLTMQERCALWEELKESKRNKETGLLEPAFMQYFPLNLREPEALKALQQDPDMPDPRWFAYVELIDLEKAKSYLYPRARDGEYETRRLVYSTMGNIVKEHRHDPQPFLLLCKRSINERDPIRGYIYDNLSALDFAKFTEENMNCVIEMLEVTADQIDMSYETADYMSIVLEKVLLKRPRDYFRLLPKLTSMEPFGHTVHLPRDRASVPAEVWLLMDDFFMSYPKTKERNNYIRATVGCSTFSGCERTLKCFQYILDHPKVFTVFPDGLQHILLGIKCGDLQLGSTTFEERMDYYINKFGLDAMESDFFTKYVSLHRPEKINEFIETYGYTDEVKAQRINFSDWPFKETYKLATSTQRIMAKLFYDRILHYFQRVDDTNMMSHMVIEIAREGRFVSRMSALHPSFFIALMDAYLVNVQGHINKVLETDPEISSELGRAALRAKYVPIMFARCLANSDNPTLAVQTVLDKLETSPNHLCSQALPLLVSKLSRVDQLRMLQSPLTEDVRLAVMLAAGMEDLKMEARRVFENSKSSLRGPGLTLVINGCQQLPSFWDVLHQTTDHILTQRAIEMPLLPLLLQGRLETYVNLLRTWLSKRPVDSNTLQRLLKRASLVDRFWLIDQLPRLYAAVEAGEVAQSDSTSADIQKTCDLLLSTLTRLTQDMESLFAILRYLTTRAAVERCLELIPSWMATDEACDALLCEWIVRLKSNVPDSLETQALLLSRIKSAESHYRLLTSLSWLEDGGILHWIHPPACDKEQLACKLSQQTSHHLRYCAYVLLINAGTEKTQEIFNDLKSAFQFDFVDVSCV
eukprot:Blabericola_migrator_1__5249@NODE_269_length_10566_cov_217_328317_g225_i0_p1_GENE_NODE_269_length_10566_cov_217_328317_g225_i0NODE_269_length_10566_cov_217_328317_g225_i0_p1_ORF_typecomplete_len1125_score214_56DNA_alkylation/PF08713_11/71DNA_alkylation/PF08713_11/13DNA_alkylation/PF08713_11/452oxoacid_dh/PF00198_23/0_054PPR_3/PF13812_6/0_61_NODE_269_length_10566_cov_217_328317_g225_i022155589